MFKKIIISLFISYTLLLGLASQNIQAKDVRTVDYHPSIRTFNVFLNRLAIYENWQTWIENYLNKLDEDLVVENPKQPIEEDRQEDNEEQVEIDKQPEPKKEVPNKEETKEPVPEPVDPPAETKQPTKQKPNDPKPKAPAPKKPVESTPPKPEPQPKPEPKPEKEESVEEVNNNISAFEQRVVQLTNEERRAHGLQPLVLDQSLSAVAREKSVDMARNNYFSHTSPTYGSPFDMMAQFNISYRAAGENIAMGHGTPEQVVNGWMNSDGHRANILNASFTHIGVGYVENGNYWTQMFIGK